MTQHVIVVDSRPEWETMFREEASLIRQILGDNCTAIYHIGSTAVKGLKAKPVIDIMPVVVNLEAVDLSAAVFEDNGYEYLGEFGIAGRRYLRKGGDERTHQIHIFQQDDRDNIKRHVAVRDYLRTHKDKAEQYGRLKERLARRYPYDIEKYCDGKDAFVSELEKTALHWKKCTDSCGLRDDFA